MSRSYKKYPLCHCAGHDGTWKKIFNRKIRRSMKNIDIPDGNAYKKYNESWYISDWPNYCTFEDYKSSYWREDETDEEMQKDWKKYYKRK